MKREFKLGDKLHGFTVTELRDLEEISARMVRMSYDKNGADLIWLDRPDENKTFGIAFKTLPKDHTGVFHIIEHSVLCGSEKYPVKEPFVELIKRSLQTFLNAITFPDKTIYPISSRNDKDFLNLMDVYLDAVFHPLAITDPHSFRQEGWHYELEEADGELIANGVVYSEMKGSFASRDRIMDYELDKLLFPDTCYGYESGGHPDHITELTYENFRESHAKYYHPSNSRIFLDGDLDIDTVLARLDGVLSEYEKKEIDSGIPLQSPVSGEVEAFYEVTEDSEDQLLTAGAWVYGDCADYDKTLALEVIAEVISGSNEAPLTKMVLEEGLASDLDVQISDGILQPQLVITMRDVPEDKKDAVWPAVEKKISEICDEGIDRKRIRAALNRLEFLTREKDYGTVPRGLIYGLKALDTWLYDEDPMLEVLIGDRFERLRARVDEGWYDELLREAVLDNPHKAKVTLLPSKTLSEEKAERERERLAKVKASWTDKEIEETIESFKALRERQSRTDSREDLDKLPSLELSDVSRELKEPAFEVKELDGVKLIHTDINTDGIIYLNMYYDISDFSVRELQDVRVITKMLGGIETTNYDVISLLAEIDENIGRFGTNLEIKGKDTELDKATPYLSVGIAVLEGKKKEALRIAKEILFESKFVDAEFILNQIRQGRIGLEQHVISSGDSYAKTRVEASTSVQGALNEAISGIDFLRYIQEREKKVDEDYCEQLSALYKKMFSKSRMTVAITGECDEAWIGEFIAMMNDDPMGEAFAYEKSLRPRREGFNIAAQISYASKGGNIVAKGGEITGSDAVASGILTYGFLWNEIRVKGGAYGTGIRVSQNGDIRFGSFRDPSGDRSLVSYDKASAALRALASSDESIDNYIISTIGAQEPLLSARMEGFRVAGWYFSGQNKEERQKRRDEMLETTKEDLLKSADKIDAVMDDANICIIGGAEIVDAAKDMLDAVETI